VEGQKPLFVRKLEVQVEGDSFGNSNSFHENDTRNETFFQGRSETMFKNRSNRVKFGTSFVDDVAIKMRK
jgi:hypothetical protein